MALENSCGQFKQLEELLSATIKGHTTHTNNWAIATVKKTWAPSPSGCAHSKLTLHEKLASAVSVFNGVIALNVVDEPCLAMTCASELDCNTSDMSFFDKLERAMCYTTDGDWAIYTINIG